MSAPFVAVVVPAEEVHSTSAEALAEAATEGLPPGSRVVVGDAARGSPDVVVVVRWGEGHGRASLHVTTRDGRTVDRDVAFGPADPDVERGRALGYAVVAMLPEEMKVDDGPKEAPPKPAPPPPAPQPAPRPTVERPLPDRGSPAPARLWIEAAGQGAAAIGGSGSSLGGAAAARVALGHIVFRAGVAARFGSVSDAGASGSLVRGDLGVGYWTFALDPRVGVGIRAGVLLLRHALSRPELSGGTSSGSHVLAGAELMGEASFALDRSFALTAATGTELAFGTTRVFVGSSSVADLPPVRLVLEVGARVTF